MGKIYLVDSENVGDIWVPLLVPRRKVTRFLYFIRQRAAYEL